MLLNTPTLEAACERALARYRGATRESARRYEAACEAMPGGNTRTVLHYDPYPITLSRGSGSSVWDVDGHRYTDFLGEYSAGLYGHSNAHIRAAVKAALDDGIVLGAPNAFEAAFATILCERFPSCERVRFCNSGTESNLTAINAARAFTGRSHVMVFNGAYHGSAFSFTAGASPSNAPYPFVIAEFNDLEHTLPLIERHAGELAAIVVEPMLGGGGCIPAETEFLKALRDSAHQYGVVLIFDEVMTSRLSSGGLQAKLDVIPDLTTLGKYLGGGLTFGAFGGRRDIMDQFDPRSPNALPHAGTFNNNVLTMAAGLTGLRDIYTPEVARAHNARADTFRMELNRLFEERDVPAQATGIGSLMCVHFQRGAIRRPSDLSAVDPEVKMLFHLEMLAAGFYLARRGFMSLSLPLGDEDYAGFRAALGDFLDNYAPLFDS